MKAIVQKSKDEKQWDKVLKDGEFHFDSGISEIGTLHVKIQKSDNGDEINGVGSNGFFILRNRQNYENMIRMIRENTFGFIKKGWSQKEESSLVNTESVILDIINKKVSFDVWGMNIVLIYISLHLTKVYMDKGYIQFKTGNNN